MDDLVDLEEPGPADVARVRERLGDGHPLTYLFDRAKGPGWLQALAADELLLAPSDTPWVGGPYVARLTETHPDAVRDWLRTLPTDLDSKQAADLLRIVRQPAVTTPSTWRSDWRARRRVAWRSPPARSTSTRDGAGSSRPGVPPFLRTLGARFPSSC